MDTALITLRRKMEERNRLMARRQQIENNIATMEALLPQLQRSVRQEQEDVDRLESGGLSSFLYGVLGRQEEKLEKERREAGEARQKYQDALRTLQTLNKEKEDLEASLRALEGAAAAYQRAFDEKRRRLLAAKSPEGDRLRRLEEDGRQLRALKKELREAQNAGQQVMDQISAIQRSLESASAWGAADLFSDSFFADLGKYGSLDEAQRQIGELNRLLGRFSRELEDINVSFQLSADLGGGMRFADIFFDNVFTDAMAYRRIDSLRNQVRDIRLQTERHMELLDRKQTSVAGALQEKKQAAEELILQAV